jgi:hypothetical protein
VDATGNITAKLCEVWSEFNIFCTLVTMATNKIGIGRTNFSAVAMDLKTILISFIKLHET